MDEELAPDPSWGDPQPAGDDITGSAPSEEVRPDPSWGAATEPPQEYALKETRSWGIPEEMSASAPGAAARGFAREVVPSTAGGVTGVVVGAPVSAAATPFAGIPAGIVAGIGAAEGTRHLQDKLLDMLGLREGTGFFSKNQEMVDQLTQEWSKFGGELSSALPTFGTGIARNAAGKVISTVPVAGRAFGGGLQGGIETGREMWQGEDLDPAKIGANVAAGALLAKPRGWVPGGHGELFNNQQPPQTPIHGPVQGPPVPGGGTVPGQGFRMVGNPRDVQGTDVGFARPTQGPEAPLGNRTRSTTDDVIYQGQETPREGEILPPEGAQADTLRDAEFAMSQRDALKPDDPMREFWDNHIARLNEEINNPGKGRPSQEEDARWGPARDGDFTYVTDSDMARSNDVTTVAKGVAAENPRAPQVEGAGNPVGAPMQGRIAQRPSEPGRDYRKLPAPEQKDLGTTTGDHAPDIMTAMMDEAPSIVPEAPRSPAPQTPPPRMEATPAMREAAARRQAPEQQPEMRSEDITATVTPEEQARIQEGFKAVASMPKVVKQIQALPPKIQLRVLEQAANIIERHQKAEYDVGARPKTATGVVARSKADEARKSGALRAIDQAVQEHPRGKDELDVPLDKEGKQALVGRLEKMLGRSQELYRTPEGQAYSDNAGREQSDPLHYKPQKQSPSMVLARAAAKVVKSPTPANIRAYRATEKAAEGAKLTDIEATKDFQQTRAIEAGIEKRPGLLDTTYENQLAKHAVEPEPERQLHEKFDNSLQDESAVYKGQHDQLVDWINNLSDENYKALRDHDIENTLRTTNDPRETMHALMQDLADVQRKRPPVLELVPAEDGAVVKRTKVTDRKSLAAAEGRSEGRRIDPNSAEGKAIAAAALKLQPKTKDLAGLEAAEREGAQNKPKVIDGSDKSALEHWAKFIADEGGAVPLDRLLRNMSQWMQTAPQRVRDFFHPHGDPAAFEYGKQIGERGTLLNTRLTRIKAEALANARSAVLPDGSVPLPADFGRMYRAKENGTMASLTPAQRTYWDNYVQPLYDRAGTAYDELRDISQRLKLPNWETMPERKTNGTGFMDWMPRRRKGEQAWDRQDEFEPTTNRSLSNWAASAMDRDWFALQDRATGTRKIFHINEDGKMVFYQNQQAGRGQTAPASFDPRNIGAVLKARGPNNTVRDWVVDHATIDELMAHGRDQHGPLKFIDNPVVAVSDAYVGLRGALAKVKLLENIITDPEFQRMSTRRPNEAERMFGKGNYDKTDLPQLSGRYMPKPMAWAFDDLVKTGFHYGENSFWNSLARFAQNTLKPFYFLGPEVHVFNELDKYLVGRGVQGVTTGLPSGAKHFWEGLRSVRNQDALQAEIMDNGGNPMFMHSAVTRLMPNIGRAVNEDMSLRPWKYDPIMKVFGVNTRDTLSHWYQQSNKVMWWQSDVLYTAVYSELKAKGLSPREAVKETEKIIDSYVVPTTMGKTIGLEGTDAGRVLQQIATDPISANFGRFHYGLYKMGANVIKNMLGPNSTMSQRLAGAGQAAMLIAMANIVYPALSSLYSKVTGNEHSEFEKRGITRLASLPAEIAHGEKDIPDILRQAWTPSTVASAGMEVSRNRDFAGRKIIEPGSSFGAKVGQALEYGLGVVASPVKQASQGNAQGGPGFALQRFVEGNFGLKTPSPGASRYQDRREINQRRDVRAREKKPRGVIEQGVNWLGGR